MNRGIVRTAFSVAAAGLAIVLVALTALPYADTNRWFVRMADFPRLQILIAILLLVPVLGVCLRRPVAYAAILGVAVAAAATIQAATLWAYRPGGANFVESCPQEDRIAVMVANVLMTSRNATPLLEMVRREKPDLLLALETNEWWHQALAPLKDEMPHLVHRTGDDYYGIHLFSRLPLGDPAIRYFAGDDTPAVVSDVALRSGETVRFYGLHPRPPHPFQSAAPRDAELYAAALAVDGDERVSILAGDLNATPWEATIERMRRIAGLIDPRRGYGYVPTYSARSWWRAWPLDHVFHGAGFATLSLERLGPFGSDHYPYLARLCRLRGPAGEPAPGIRDGDLEEAREAIAAAARD